MVVQLIRPPMSRLLTDFTRGLDHFPDEFFCDLLVIAENIRNLSAEGFHRESLFVAERIGENGMEMISFCSTCERKRNARCSCCILNHRIADSETSISLCTFNDSSRHSILHTAGWVSILISPRHERNPVEPLFEVERSVCCQ